MSNLWDEIVDDAQAASDKVGEAVKSFFEPRVKLPRPSINKSEQGQLGVLDQEEEHPMIAATRILKDNDL